MLIQAILFLAGTFCMMIVFGYFAFLIVGRSEDDSISRKRIDDNTIEETSKRNGQIVRVSLSIVSEDAKSMRVACTDIQRSGKTMTYTAEKRP